MLADEGPAFFAGPVAAAQRQPLAGVLVARRGAFTDFVVDARANSVPPRMPSSPIRSTSPSGFAEDADEAGQVELLVFAAKANAGDLNRQVVLPHRRNMLLAADRVGHAVAVAPFQVIDQFRRPGPARRATAVPDRRQSGCRAAVFRIRQSV